MANMVSRIYSNFRGVDFRGEECDLSRSPDSLNMWKDYKQANSIRTRPGMQLRHESKGKIYGFFFYNDALLVHCDDQMYKITPTGKELLAAQGLNKAPSNGFVYENIFYFMDGAHYLKYDGVNFSEVIGYVPTTSIGRKPAGSGTAYEDVNMISEYRINTFVGDGESTAFHLDAENIDSDYEPTVTVDGVAISAANVTCDYAKGVVTVKTAPDVPQTEGQDNVAIKYKKSRAGYKESILGCTLLQLFDNRVFVSGNPEYPNVLWHCSIDDPTYFSDLDYYREGLDAAAITGMAAGNNALWVFREPSDANTTVFYHVPTIDETYGKIYPSSHSSISTGCVGKAINFNDDIVFFSDRGMEGISGDITTEQVVAHRSSLVDRKLTAEEKYKDMILAEWEGYLLVFIGTKVYLADSRGVFNNENHIEYEWFYWDLGIQVTCAAVHNGVLYFGDNVGNVWELTEEGNAESYWVTAKDKFGHPHMLKTTNKKGCVVEATGDIAVYAKTEYTEFEEIGNYENVTDYFVSRIKRKKFKDIQLKLYSETGFSLESVTLEAFIGGYIKR